jgi:hypothetical protein
VAIYLYKVENVSILFLVPMGRKNYTIKQCCGTVVLLDEAGARLASFFIPRGAASAKMHLKHRSP